MVAPIIYAQGTTFGKWTIVGMGTSTKQGKTWRCQRECGTIRDVLGTRLRYGRSTSCGCNSIKATKDALWKGVGEIGLNLWSSYRRGAVQRNIEFSLSIEYMWDLFIQQNRRCALTGTELTMFSWATHYSYSAKGYKGGITGKRSHGTASLDRIDNTRGYVIGNVQWVHKDVNIMKRDHTTEHFLYLCNLVVQHNQIG